MLPTYVEIRGCVVVTSYHEEKAQHCGACFTDNQARPVLADGDTITTVYQSRKLQCNTYRPASVQYHRYYDCKYTSAATKSVFSFLTGDASVTADIHM